jgi:hypothetical protein
MIILAATSEILEVVSSSTSALHVVAAWVDITTSTFTPDSTETSISSATTTTVVAAPGSSTQRQVKAITIRNTGAAANTITVQKDVSATNYEMTPDVTLAAGESLCYGEQAGWYVLDAYGRRKATASEIAGSAGRAVSFLKVGATMEAAGVLHSHYNVSGFPGAWTLGTPGAAGATLTSADSGCLPFANASSGGVYLTGITATMSVAGGVWLVDMLWYNTGLTVTTTTAQTVNSVTFPARDLNGSTNGEGVEFGILVTTATTNVSAVTNTTASYTDSDGNSGATATMASFPATATLGSVVPFQLAAGDKGVRSIQSVTLGTSYGGGAISIVAFRRIAFIPCPLANAGGYADFEGNPGVRLYDNSCLHLWQLPTATTATTVQGVVNFAER